MARGRGTGIVGRLFKAFGREIRALTTPEIAFALLAAIAAFAVKYYLRGGISPDDVWTVAVPAIWAGCVFALYYIVKAAIHIRSEDISEWDKWEPAIPEATEFKPSKPSILPLATTTAVGVGFFVAVLLVTFVLVPTPRPSPNIRISYPWISTNYRITNGSDNTVTAIVPSVIVRDHPDDIASNRLTQSSLYHLKLTLSIPVAFNSQGGRYLCQLAQFSVQEWNNDDAWRQPLGILDVTRNVTILKVSASARNSNWSGIVIVSRRGAEIEVVESMNGSVADDNGTSHQISVTERQVGVHRTRVPDALTLTPDLLRKADVPTVRDGVEAKRIPCPALRRFGP
jgi:hypothetical protein